MKAVVILKWIAAIGMLAGLFLPMATCAVSGHEPPRPMRFHPDMLWLAWSIPLLLLQMFQRRVVVIVVAILEVLGCLFSAAVLLFFAAMGGLIGQDPAIGFKVVMASLGLHLSANLIAFGAWIRGRIQSRRTTPSPAPAA